MILIDVWQLLIYHMFTPFISMVMLVATLVVCKLILSLYLISLFIYSLTFIYI